MTISTSKRGVWVLDDTYKRVSSGFWAYNNDSDPGVSSYWIWGGETGDGTLDAKSSPVQLPGTWCRIGDGGNFAIKTDGTLWGWGASNYRGRLGDGTTISRSSPIQIPGTQWSRVVGNSIGLALKNDGTLWSWGYNTQGQIGDSTTVHKSSPVQVPGTLWCQVSTGYRQSSAMKTDGTLWTWGFSGDAQGQLGQNNQIPRSSPTQIPGTQWVDIDMQMSPVARKTDGTLWIWGNNFTGTLGNNLGGGAQYQCSPIQVPGTAWTDASSGSSSGRHVLATKNDGTLWSWGRNNYGQLGISTDTNRSSPVQVPGTQWSIIMAGGEQSHAIKTDGTLWAWGRGACGQLGINTANDRSSPIQVPGTSWSNVYKACNNTTMARKTNP